MATLPFGPLTRRSVHLRVDMQNMFAEATPWRTPWMARVLPVVEDIAGHHAERTVFTRFIPPAKADDMPGSWRRYLQRWAEITRSVIDPKLRELVPSLARFAPPAAIIDKRVYSPFVEPSVPRLLRERQADALVIIGAETDVCVLAAGSRRFRVSRCSGDGRPVQLRRPNSRRVADPLPSTLF